MAAKFPKPWLQLAIGFVARFLLPQEALNGLESKLRAPTFTNLARHALVLAAMVNISVAHASPVTWQFNFSGATGTASGTFTTDDQPTGGPYLITALSGLRDGVSMLLLAPGAYQANDNLLFASSPYFDFGGLSYQVGADKFNLYASNGVVRECSLLATNCTAAVTSDPVMQLTVTRQNDVPEPASMSLVGLALLASAWVRRRRGLPEA